MTYIKYIESSRFSGHRFGCRPRYRSDCRIFGILLALLFAAASVFAAPAPVTIKLASLVPENTPWGAALNRMAVEWKQASNGEVDLKIYHNGTQGSEADVLRKLRSNNIQAAILTSFGLNTITPEIMALSCPFLIRNNAELDLVLSRVKPELERRINDKHFFMLAWSKVGWVRFFSKAPVFVPDDLKKQKLGTNETDANLMDAFKAMGYKMVPVAQTQILVSLSGGQIDAVYQSPVSAGGLQIFGLAKNMASINIAPFMGGIVITEAAWKKVPDKYKPELLRIAKRHEAELDGAIQKLEAETIDTMKQYGLVINQVSPAQELLWDADFKRVVPKLLGKTFNKEMYEKIREIVGR